MPCHICSIFVLRLILGQLSSKTTTFYVIDKVVSEYPFIVVYACKKCGELNYLTPTTFWNIADFGAMCERCSTINTITLENEELKTSIVPAKITNKTH
jgi:hypothetical protein